MRHLKSYITAMAGSHVKAGMMMARCCAVLILAFCLSSCFKEKPIKAPNYANNGDVFMARMGENYTTQVYFNIQSGTFVDSNSKYDYDMAFDCNPSNNNIWVNGSKLMLVCRTGKNDFNQVSWNDTAQGFHVELGSGGVSDNAIGSWSNGFLSNKEVYIFNMGEDSAGNNLGFRKVQMQDMSGGSTYRVTFCNMDGSDMHTAAVTKQANRNRVFLSFKNGGTTHDFEPDNTNWDLLFSQYSVYFADQHLPYKVTGVLTNPAKTYAYFVDSTSEYGGITLAKVDPSKFNTNLDNIGYTWKQYAYGQYSVTTSYNFIIKSDSRYYKLRFLSFYDPITLDKGYPKFQVNELQ